MVDNTEELKKLLFKKHLHDKTIIDLINNFSSKTIDYLIRDLKIHLSKNEQNEQDKTHNKLPDKIIDKVSNKLYIFSDGGCINNGRKNAKGGYSVFFTDNPKSEYYQFNFTKLMKSDDNSTPVTNNQAELRAIRKIFKTIYDNVKYIRDDSKSTIENNPFDNKEIIICTDSMYSINCVTKWIKNWSKNGWINSKGEVVKNKELIEDIADLEKKIIKATSARTSISFRHVMSHQCEPDDKKSLEWFIWYGNKQVDDNITKIINQEIN